MFNLHMLNKYGIKVNNRVINTIIKISNESPEYYDTVEKNLLDIIKNDEIKFENIDKLINLLRITLRNIMVNKKIKFKHDEKIRISGEIIKFLIILLIDEKMIIITNKEKFVNDTNRIIYMCVELMLNSKKEYKFKINF